MGPTGSRLSIKEQRIRLGWHLSDNPSLHAGIEDAMAQAYQLAAIEAEGETGLPEDNFPAVCPFSSEQAMDASFWPDGSSFSCDPGK
jgi:hypothetical protein